MNNPNRCHRKSMCRNMVELAQSKCTTQINSRCAGREITAQAATRPRHAKTFVFFFLGGGQKQAWGAYRGARRQRSSSASSKKGVGHHIGARTRLSCSGWATRQCPAFAPISARADVGAAGALIRGHAPDSADIWAPISFSGGGRRAPISTAPIS